MFFNESQEKLREIFGVSDDVVFKWVSHKVQGDNSPERWMAFGKPLRIEDVKDEVYINYLKGFQKELKNDDFIEERGLVLYRFSKEDTNDFDEINNNETSNVLGNFWESLKKDRIEGYMSSGQYVTAEQHQQVKEFFEKYTKEDLNNQSNSIDIKTLNNKVLDEDPVGKFADIFLIENEKEVSDSLGISRSAYFIELVKILISNYRAGKLRLD